ncbi:hypothetical protein [Rhizobium rhizogenes]|uniref:hypothetical protein n=1 Tax=Rhizobium rhizogenes TaxID=359 RepID=UPI00068B9D20|nr:hypothetical protein [Rhizobium rhizogenes]
MGTAVGTKLSGRTQWLLRFLCAFALLSVGFAHQPIIANADELTPSALAQYRLPDGTLPVLCVTERTADGKEHSKAHVPSCEACRISSAALLPAPPMDICEHLAFASQDIPAPKTEAFHRQLYPPNTGPRAPPLLRITIA